MATTEIKTWLASMDFESDEEIYALYKTVEGRTSNFPFTWVEQNAHSGKRCYLACPHITDSLLLTSESAIAEFLRQLREYMKGFTKEMSIEHWYSYKKSLED